MIRSRTKFIALVVTLIFLALFAALLIFWHMVNSHRESIAEGMIEIEKVESQQKALVELRKMESTAKTDKEILESFFLADAAVIDFLTLVESLGEKHGGEIITNALTVNPINGTFEELVIAMSIEGSYDSVMRILILLENLPYQSSVSKVRLQQGGETGGQWRGDVELRITKFKKV